MWALTLRQPWASLVAIGVKQVETRSWTTAYRGPLAIHSSKRLSNARMGEDSWSMPSTRCRSISRSAKRRPLSR